MIFLPECGADKICISLDRSFLLIKWVHNDFMYVRFAGMRNTKTWSKSRCNQKSVRERNLQFTTICEIRH